MAHGENSASNALRTLADHPDEAELQNRTRRSPRALILRAAFEEAMKLFHIVGTSAWAVGSTSASPRQPLRQALYEQRRPQACKSLARWPLLGTSLEELCKQQTGHRAGAELASTSPLHPWQPHTTLLLLPCRRSCVCPTSPSRLPSTATVVQSDLCPPYGRSREPADWFCHWTRLYLSSTAISPILDGGPRTNSVALADVQTRLSVIRECFCQTPMETPQRC